MLGGWGFARWRVLRSESGPVALPPRRGRCRSCRSTHVLLPDVVLARRVDTAAVIGVALRYAAGGAGEGNSARLEDRPGSTVRGWIRRIRAVATRGAVL